MERDNILKLVLFVVFLALLEKGFSSPVAMPIPVPPFAPRPLCASQFALVNHACAMLPFTPGPPPAPSSPFSPPPSPISPPPPDGPGRRHGHRHSRRHRHRHSETPIQQECCRWLQAVDNECVCDVLVRLPPFLSRPIHQYVITVDENCSVTFSCGSRLQA